MRQTAGRSQWGGLGTRWAGFMQVEKPPLTLLKRDRETRGEVGRDLASLPTFLPVPGQASHFSR